MSTPSSPAVPCGVAATSKPWAGQAAAVSHAPGGQLVLAAGRSSDTARVRGLLATPAGAGPLHTSRRNRFASLMGTDNYRYIIL